VTGNDTRRPEPAKPTRPTVGVPPGVRRARRAPPVDDAPAKPREPRPLPKFEEKIGTGSVIDFLFAPFLMLANHIGWTAREPNLVDRRDAWLGAGFYVTAAVIAVFKYWLV